MSYLTEELVRQGHDVTLFASGDSVTSATLVPGCERALWRDPECRETLPHHVRLMDLVFRQAHRFDVIHFHCDYIHFPLLRYHRTPTVTTLARHGSTRTISKPLFQAYPEVPLVSISDDQRASDSLGKLAGNRLPRFARRPAHLSGQTRRLSAIHRAHLSREAAGSRHRNRLPVETQIEGCRQDLR